MTKLKDFLTDFKTYILLVVFFIGIGIAFAGVAKIPEKVKAVEAKAEKTEDNVQQLASDIKTYIAVNEAQKTETEKRETLMLKLIEQNNDKGKADTHERRTH